MSIRYKLASAALRAAGTKKLFALPEEELLEKVRGMNRRRQFQMPKDHKAVYGDRLILGQYHCLTIQLGQKRTKKAILYLFGGGMIVGPDQGDIKTARDFAVRSGSDCWFPYYPLCTDHCITETYEMVLQCYREMAECYGAEHISLVGFSSGGALAVGLPLHLNALNRPTGMPRQVIAVSPGSIPSSQKERAEMQALNSRDVMVDAAFMETDRKIMTKGQPVPVYMLSGPKGDFTGLPPVHFYYGGDEVLSVFCRCLQSGECPLHHDHRPGNVPLLCNGGVVSRGASGPRRNYRAIALRRDTMPPFVFCIQDCYYIRAAYQNPRPHRHFAAHVLIGLDGPFITEIDGKHMQATGIAIASNVVHTVRTDADLLVIFIDELTPMARFVKYVLLQGMSCRSLGKETAAAVSGLWQNVRTEEEAVRAAKGTGNLLGLEKLVPPEEDSRVLAAAAYMKRAQALEAVTIQEVAQAVHLSPSRLTHLFHQETGISPRLYLANLKLERAFYRMQEGMTLTEACMAAGFATPSHMADTSQNLLGLSMSYVKEIVSGSYDTLDHKTADRQKYPADLL